MNPSKKAGVFRKGQQILYRMKSCCTLVCEINTNDINKTLLESNIDFTWKS